MDDKKLPFKRISTRAILLRREDGAIFGVLHRDNGMYALPGGGMEKGETPPDTICRELDEEHFRLINPDNGWKERLAVDYYSGYQEFSLWYIFIVDDIQSGGSDEIVDARWLDQTQDIWYPCMREKILLAIKNYVPDMLKVDVSVLESW